MHMVKATLPELQPKRDLGAGSHDNQRELSGNGRSSSLCHTSQLPRATTDEWWEQAKREPKCIASLSRWKRGIAWSRSIGKNDALYGNGVIIVPNVHAVMAWAARKTVAVNER